jgi:cytosine deaminase
MPADVVLTNALLPDGSVTTVPIRAGVVVDGSDGISETFDVGGRLLLPAMAEPHAHLDKAFTADRFPNPTGDLMSAIEIMEAQWPSVDQGDIEVRATLAARRLVAAGATAIRTHVDLNPEAGLKSVRGLLSVRDHLTSLADIQVVPLTTYLTGPNGRDGRALLASALESDLDGVGACPHIEEDPVGAIGHALSAAVDAGLPVDLHFDEVLDASVQHLLDLAFAVDRHGLGGRVTASHCVSHGLLDPIEQRRVARALAGAGVAVIANPRTNLFLQARGSEQAPPRGILGIQAMMDEGVIVAAGADNIQDPFYSIGRSDPLETASLLIAATHRTVDEAWEMVSSSARRVMGVGQPQLTPGSPADFVAIEAGSLREAIADQSADRMVFRGGQLVSRTTVTSWTADD